MACTTKGEDDEDDPWIEFGEHDDDGERNDGDNDLELLAGLDNLFLDPDPYQQFHFTFGNNDDAIRININGIKAENGQTIKTTGLTVWRASNYLCEYLYAHPDIVRNKSIVELGAGLGLCGILAKKLGARLMVLTDGDTDTLAQMRQNVALNMNGGEKNNTIREEGIRNRILCKQLRWGRNVEKFCEVWAPNESGGFDVVMGSDIIYTEGVLEPLFQTVSVLLSKEPGSIFFLSYARRNVYIDLVFDCAKRFGLEWTEPADAAAAEGVYIFSRTSDRGTYSSSSRSDSDTA